MTEIVTVQETLEVPKECKEIADAVVDILQDALDKKGIGEIAAENIAGIMVAAEGYDKVTDEAKSKYRSDLAAYVSKKLMDTLIPVKDVATP